MGRPERGDRPGGLGPRRRRRRVGVDDAADRRELEIEVAVRRGVARRPERALDDGSVGQRDGDEVLRADVGAAQSAGLDQQDARVTVDARRVAERQRDEPRPVDRPVRGGDLVAELIEASRLGSRDPDPHPADAAVRPGEVRDRRELDRRPGGGRRRPSGRRSRDRSCGPAASRGAAPSGIATSSSSTPGGRSADSIAYTSGPRSSATQPRTASTRGSGRVTRGARSSRSSSVSPARHCRVGDDRGPVPAAGSAPPRRPPVPQRRRASTTREPGTPGPARRPAPRGSRPDGAVPRVVGRQRQPQVAAATSAEAYCWTRTPPPASPSRASGATTR